MLGKMKILRRNRLLVLIIFIILAASLLVSRDLFRSGYFPMHDDVQIMRLYEMEKCFKDGQIPCRWVPDMGAGFGHPLFNFHQVFPYYLGMVFRFFGLSFINTAKALFFLTFIVSGLAIYLLAKELWGKEAGLVASILFLFVPYRAVDVYVRGALTEIWGVTFFPLIFLSLYKFVKENKFRWFLASILSLVGLFLSHNIMTVLFTPLAAIWALFWWLKLRKKTFPLRVLAVFLWAFGIAAFFLLPAFFEKSLVTMSSSTTGYYDFQNHFVTVKQLFFDRFWGYGGSVFGQQDEMSFQIGWPHWLIAAFGGMVVVGFYLNYLKAIFKRRLKLKEMGDVLLMTLLFVFWLTAIFFTHAKSFFVWASLPILKYVQFPWRFLGLAMFFNALLAAGFLSFFRGKKFFQAIILICLAVAVVMNVGYFRPLKIMKINDNDILSGKEWRRQSMTTLLDYYPTGVKLIPQEMASESPAVALGRATITNFQKFSSRWQFEAEVETPTAQVILPIFNFPVWEIFVDGWEIDYSTDSQLGLILVDLPPGEHYIRGNLVNTPLREAANKVSLISLFALTGLGLLKLYRYAKISRKKL